MRLSRANPRTTHANAGIAAWNFKLKAEIHSYEDCARAMVELGGAFGLAEIGPKMVLAEEASVPGFDPPAYAIILYATTIIRYYPDGSFSVDNGGFNTPTTRERLQAVLPDGYLAFHESKHLGLWAREKLWPLDHSKRIKDGEIVP